MESVIYQNKRALNEYLCDDLITMFELNKGKHKQGVTIGGINTRIKKTYDIIFDNMSTEYWSECNKHIINVLYENLKEWRKQFKLSEKNSFALPNHLTLNDSFLLQKYEKNSGKYNYHDDFYVLNNKEYRVATFIFYLNTIEDGGETEFMDTFKVKPEKGKLVLFPSVWNYTHRGKMPISDNKYIITGWLYGNEFSETND